MGNILKIILILVIYNIGYAWVNDIDSSKIKKDLRISYNRTATNPKKVFVSDSGNDSQVVKTYPLDSIVPDSVRVSDLSHKAHTTAAGTADTNLLAASATDSSFKKLTRGQLRAAVDSVRKSGTAQRIIHGVTARVVPKARSDSTFENSHISENGDTTKVTYTGAVSDTFGPSGVSNPPGGAMAGCSAPNGDCYFTTSSSLIYQQVGGSGSLTLVATLASTLSGITANSDGDIFVTSYNYRVFKRTAGVGNFDSIPGSKKYWDDITCNRFENDRLYGIAFDTVWTSDDEGVSWTFFQRIQYAHYVTSTPNGDVYVNTTNGIYPRGGTVFIKEYSSPAFLDLNMWQVEAVWYGNGCDTAGNIYASAYGITAGGVYKRIGGVGNFVKIQGSLPYQTDYVGKTNGSAYSLGGGIYIKSSESIKNVFQVSGGNSTFSGKVTIENTPLTAPTTVKYLLAKNVEPDNEIKKIPVDSIASIAPPSDNKLLQSTSTGRMDTTNAKYDPVYGDVFFPRNFYLGDTTTSGVMYYSGALGRISDLGYDSNAILYGVTGTTRGPRTLMFGDQFWAYPGYWITSSGVDGGIILGSAKKGIILEAQQQGRVIVSTGAGTVFMPGNRSVLPVGDTSELPDTSLLVNVTDTSELVSKSIPLRLSAGNRDSALVIDTVFTSINGRLRLPYVKKVESVSGIAGFRTGSDSNEIAKIPAESLSIALNLDSKQDTLDRSVNTYGFTYNSPTYGLSTTPYFLIPSAAWNIAFRGDDFCLRPSSTFDGRLVFDLDVAGSAYTTVWTQRNVAGSLVFSYTDTADARDASGVSNETAILSITDSVVSIGSIDFPTSSKMYTDNQFHVATNGCKIKTNIPSDVNASVTLNVLGRGVFVPFNVTAHFLLLRTPAVLLNKAFYGYGGPTKIYIYSEDGYVSFWFNREYTSPIYGGFAITLMSDSLNVNYTFTDTLKPSFASDSPLPDSVSLYDFRIQKVDTLSRLTSLYEFASVQAGGLTGSDRLKDSSGAVIVDGDSTWLRSSNVKMTGITPQDEDSVIQIGSGKLSKRRGSKYSDTAEVAKSTNYITRSNYTSGYLIKTDIKKTRATSMYLKIWGKHGANAVDCIASGYFDGTFLTTHRLNGAYSGIDTVFVTSRDSLEFWVAPQPSGAANLAILSFSLTCDTTFKILNVKDSTYNHGGGSEYVFRVIH